MCGSFTFDFSWDSSKYKWKNNKCSKPPSSYCGCEILHQKDGTLKTYQKSLNKVTFIAYRFQVVQDFATIKLGYGTPMTMVSIGDRHIHDWFTGTALPTSYEQSIVKKSSPGHQMVSWGSTLQLISIDVNESTRHYVFFFSEKYDLQMKCFPCQSWLGWV